MKQVSAVFKFDLLALGLGLVLISGCSSSSAPVDSEQSVDVESPTMPVGNQTDNPVVPGPAPTSTTDPDKPELEAGNQVIERVAQLYIAETQSPTALEITALARFHRLTTPQDNEPVLREQFALDSCEIGSAASQLNAESLLFPIDHILDSADAQALQLSSIEVGSSIELNADSGSYASLVVNAKDTNSSDAGTIEYSLQAGAAMSTELPAELGIDVAGAATPLQWQWKTPGRLTQALRGAVRSIATAPVLAWQPAEQGDNMRSRIMIYAGHINELNGAFQSFECVLQDDGEFNVPDNIQALFADGFAANFVEIVRYTRSLETVGDISIVNVFVQKL